MEFWKFIIVAIVQGISEILPISSSGHILIVENLLNMQTDLTLAIFLHFGSLMAVLVYYFKDLCTIVKSVFLFVFKKNREEEVIFNSKLFLYLVIASIPAGVLGLLFNDFIEETLSGLIYVFIFLLITGTLLLINKKLNRERELKEMKAIDALVIGCFQGIGILPGISRSGITIFGNKVRGFKNEDSARFAFLMFIPVSLGSFLLEVVKMFKPDAPGINQNEIVMYIVAIIISGLTTFLSLKYIFNIIKKGKLHYFAFYCYAVGVVGLIVLLVQHLIG